MKLRLTLITLLILSTSINLYAVKPDCEKWLLKHEHTGDLPAYATKKGDFKKAPPEVLKRVMDAYEETKGNFAQKLDPAKVRKVTEKDIAINLSVMSRLEKDRIRERGISENISKLVVNFSAAGVASRMGGVVKAVKMGNYGDIEGVNSRLVIECGDIFGTKTNLDAVRMAANRPVLFETFNESLKFEIDKLQYVANGPISKRLNVQIDRVAAVIKKHAKDLLDIELKDIEYEAIFKNAIDINIINVALLSEAGDTFVPLLIWTSEGESHDAVSTYLDWFKENFRSKQIRNDLAKDEKTKKIIQKYLDKAKILGETFLFGYQEDIKGIKISTGTFDEDTRAIGLGAGAIIEYGQKSGAFNRYIQMGKEDIAFSNVDVIYDIPLLYQSHVDGGKTTSMVVVPIGPEHNGGVNFMIQQPSENWNMELIEDSKLSPEFLDDNLFFNTNITFMSLHSKIIDSIGFEVKEQGTLARVKQDIGQTHSDVDADANSVLGTIGEEYDNNKSWAEAFANWSKMLKFQNGVQDFILKMCSGI